MIEPDKDQCTDALRGGNTDMEKTDPGMAPANLIEQLV
jgi:hypothetical protein